MRNLKSFLATMGLFLAMPAFSADVQMTIERELISLLDRTVLKIEFIDTSGKAVDIPKVEGLNITYQGQSSETRIVNLKRTSKVVHNYIITPSKVGDFTIGPVTCNYKGGQKEVSAKLRVIKPSDDKEALEISEMLFSKIYTDRSHPYVYEPFDLKLDVYVRDGIQTDGNFSLRGGIPESGVDGELEWTVSGRRHEEINGSIFSVYTLTTTAKTLTAGEFIFKPEVQLNLIVPRQNRRSYGFDDPFFGDFFGRQETRPILLDCNALAIQVQPVPLEGRPDEYTGGVGVLDFSVEVGPEQVQAGEPVTVKMRISGKGNLAKIIPPQIEANHNFKLYDARTLPSEGTNEVRFEQVMIPKSDAVTEIPAIRFSYFNTKTSDFRTITKGPFPIQVEQTQNQTAQVIASVPSSMLQDTEILGRDIVYLKPRPKTWKTLETKPWHETRLFQMLLALPSLLLILTFSITTKRNKLSSNVALARRQKAPKAARKHLQKAEAALKENNLPEFYEALWNAMTGYFGHRFNLAPGEVTLQTVLAHFPEAADPIQELFNTLEQRRYGMSGGATNEQELLLKQLTATLKKCERMKR